MPVVLVASRSRPAPTVACFAVAYLPFVVADLSLSSAPGVATLMDAAKGGALVLVSAFGIAVSARRLRALPESPLPN